MVIRHLKIGSLVARFRKVLSPATGQPGTTSRDMAFLAHVREVVRLHIADPYYTTRSAAADLTISRMHLNRRLRTVTGMSTHEFIRTIRLDTAYEILLHTDIPVSAIAARVGYKSVSHFAQAFRERFGATPAQCRLLPRP